MVVVMVALGLLFGDVHDAVLMLGQAVKGVEPERRAAGVDHIVARAGRDDDGEIAATRLAAPSILISPSPCSMRKNWSRSSWTS